MAFGTDQTRAPRVRRRPDTGQRKSSMVSPPFRMFFRAAPRCGRRKKGAARACARRARPAVYPRAYSSCAFILLFKAGIFLCRGLRAISWSCRPPRKSAAPLLQTLRSFQRGARARLFSAASVLAARRAVCRFLFWGCWSCACGALSFFLRRLAGRGPALPAALMAAAAAPTAALCTFGRGRAVLLRALWRIRLFHLKFLTFFRPGGGPDRLFPRRGPAAAPVRPAARRRALGTRRALAAPCVCFSSFSNTCIGHSCSTDGMRMCVSFSISARYSLFLKVAEAYGTPACPARPVAPDPVHICLGDIGQIIVEHMGKAADVNAAGAMSVATSTRIRPSLKRPARPAGRSGFCCRGWP